MRNPYITGSYVVGRKFYGRQALLEALLNGEGRAYWVIGNRRIGKTSLLRQLEALALAAGRHLPIFWDMQGCADFASLGIYLADALQERGAELRRWGYVAPSGDGATDCFALLAALAPTAARAGRELLLLCDEAEALIDIARAEPASMQRLHRALLRGAGQRVVVASTRAISELNEIGDDWAAPFTAGFDMTHLLGGLDDASARALVMRKQDEAAVAAAPEVVEAICRHTNAHPYLLQVLSSASFSPMDPCGQFRMATWRSIRCWADSWRPTTSC